MADVGELICEWPPDLEEPETDEEWDFICECISEAITGLPGFTGYWYAEVKNFGWQSLNGHKYLRASTAKDILRAILPQTDCHFRVYQYGDCGIAVNNAHHDSPMWKEWYYVNAVSEEVYEEAPSDER